MEDITNEMILNCLRFIQGMGGEVSRYSFDRYITKNIRVKESFNVVPKKLLDEGFISINLDGKEIKVILTQSGIDSITSSSTSTS